MRIRSFALMCLGALGSSLSFAQTAGWQSVQGVLRDNNDILLSGNYDLEFRVYDAPTAGTLVDMDGDAALEDPGDDVKTVTGLAINQGVFNTKFGPIAAKAFDGNGRWLQISIRPTGPGLYTALSRVELVTAPASADQLTRPASGQTAISTVANGNVGVGEPNPATKLEVNGSTRVYATPGDAAMRLISDPAGRMLRLQTRDFSDSVSGTSCRIEFGAGTGNTSADLLVQTAGGTAGGVLSLNAGGGNVGIGTSSPTAKLDVAGSAKIRDASSNTAFVIENTSAGGRPWSLLSSGNTAGTGPGFFRIRDENNAVDRLDISPTGNVGIGTASPQAPLQVKGPTSATFTNSQVGALAVQSNFVAEGAYTSIDFIGHPNDIPTARVSAYHSSSGSRLHFGTSNNFGAGITHSNSLVINEGGNVGIGTTTPIGRLEVIGSIISSGSNCCSSDQRLKKNITGLDGALQRLLALRGVSFQWKEPEKHGDEFRIQMGFIAQEVEKVLPEWVIKNKEGYRYLSTNGFPALAVEAIREQQAQIEGLRSDRASLERRMEDLAGENAKLRDRLTALENAIGKVTEQRAEIAKEQR